MLWTQPSLSFQCLGVSNSVFWLWEQVSLRRTGPGTELVPAYTASSAALLCTLCKWNQERLNFSIVKLMINSKKIITYYSFIRYLDHFPGICLLASQSGKAEPSGNFSNDSWVLLIYCYVSLICHSLSAWNLRLCAHIFNPLFLSSWGEIKRFRDLCWLSKELVNCLPAKVSGNFFFWSFFHSGAWHSRFLHTFVRVNLLRGIYYH